MNVNLNNKGFTLIEFCIANLILTVGLLGLLQAVNIAIEHNLGNILRNEAVSVADEQIVNVKSSSATSTGFTNLVSSTATVTVNRKIRSGLATFLVDRVVSNKSTNSKEVIIRVSWTYKSKNLDHRVTSLIINPAI